MTVSSDSEILYRKEKQENWHSGPTGQWIYLHTDVSLHKPPNLPVLSPKLTSRLDVNKDTGLHCHLPPLEGPWDISWRGFPSIFLFGSSTGKKRNNSAIQISHCFENANTTTLFRSSGEEWSLGAFIMPPPPKLKQKKIILQPFFF